MFFEPGFALKDPPLVAGNRIICRRQLGPRPWLVRRLVKGCPAYFKHHVWSYRWVVTTYPTKT